MQGMTSTAVASDAKKSVLFEAHSAPQPAPADKPAVSEKDDERDRAQKTLDNCKAVLESLGQSQKRVDDVLARASSVMGASEAFEAKWQAFQRKVDHVLSASLAQMRAEMAASCDRTEKVDSPAQVKLMAAQVAALMRGAQKTVFVTGAGLSTSAGIPDYRGPTGIWTMREKGLKVARVDLSQAKPTVGHRVCKALLDSNLLHCIASQNVDGLHSCMATPTSKSASSATRSTC